MCGIVGFLNAKKDIVTSKRERGLFESMLYADALRGFDSTGLFWTRNKETSIFKKAISAADFLELKPVDNILAKIDSYDHIIGHNRWATTGRITNINAHPFKIGDITLVHNGTLKNWKKLPAAQNIDVDSEAICNSINEIGAKATIEQLDGAFALVWHDAKDNTINLVTNDERPLSFAYIKKEGSEDPLDVVIASEYAMIHWLAKRQGYMIKDIFNLKKGSIVTFFPDDLENYRSMDVKLYTAPPVQHYNVGKSNSSVTKFPVAEDNSFLRQYNLKFNQKVKVFMEEFEFYQKNGGYGYLCNWVPLGETSDDIVEFRINGITIKEAEKYKNKYIQGEIVGAWRDGKLNCIIISLSIPSITVLGDKDLGYELVGTRKLLPSNIKFKVFNNKEVDKVTWERKTKHGCAWCSVVPEYKDAPDLVWESDDVFTCIECAADREQSCASRLN